MSSWHVILVWLPKVITILSDKIREKCNHCWREKAVKLQKAEDSKLVQDKNVKHELFCNTLSPIIMINFKTQCPSTCPYEHIKIGNTMQEHRCHGRGLHWPLSNKSIAFYFNRLWHYYNSVLVNHKMWVITHFIQVSCVRMRILKQPQRTSVDYTNHVKDLIGLNSKNYRVLLQDLWMQSVNVMIILKPKKRKRFEDYFLSSLK